MSWFSFVWVSVTIRVPSTQGRLTPLTPLYSTDTLYIIYFYIPY